MLSILQMKPTVPLKLWAESALILGSWQCWIEAFIFHEFKQLEPSILSFSSDHPSSCKGNSLNGEAQNLRAWELFFQTQLLLHHDSPMQSSHHCRSCTALRSKLLFGAWTKTTVGTAPASGGGGNATVSSTKVNRHWARGNQSTPAWRLGAISEWKRVQALARRLVLDPSYLSRRVWCHLVGTSWPSTQFPWLPERWHST